MAPTKIKRERGLTPPLRSGLGGFGNNDESSMAGTFTKIETADWKECGGAERFRRVRIKEFAAKNAQLALQTMVEILTRHAQLEQSCRPRIAKISKFLAVNIGSCCLQPKVHFGERIRHTL